jgi:hypothetical protein
MPEYDQWKAEFMEMLKRKPKAPPKPKDVPINGPIGPEPLGKKEDPGKVVRGKIITKTEGPSVRDLKPRLDAFWDYGPGYSPQKETFMEDAAKKKAKEINESKPKNTWYKRR